MYSYWITKPTRYLCEQQSRLYLEMALLSVIEFPKEWILQFDPDLFEFAKVFFPAPAWFKMFLSNIPACDKGGKDSKGGKYTESTCLLRCGRFPGALEEAAQVQALDVKTWNLAVLKICHFHHVDLRVHVLAPGPEPSDAQRSCQRWTLSTICLWVQKDQSPFTENAHVGNDQGSIFHWTTTILRETVICNIYAGALHVLSMKWIIRT